MRCVSLAGILLLFCRGHLPHLLEGLALLVKGLVGIVMKLARQVDDNTLSNSRLPAPIASSPRRARCLQCRSCHR